MSGLRPGPKQAVKKAVKINKTRKAVALNEKQVRNLPKNKSLPKKGKTNVDNNGSSNRSRSGGSSGGRKALGPLGRIDRRANRLTNSMIKDEVQDLRSQRRQVNSAADAANARTETFYQRGIGDLNHILGETQEYISGQNTRSQGMYDTAQIEQSAANAALQAQLGQIYGQAQQGSNAELDALGINNGQFGGQMVADQAFQQGQAAQGGANSLTNLNFMQQNAGQMMGLLGGMAQGSHMSHIGRNLNDRNDQLADTAAERSSQLGLVQEAIAEAKGSRKDVFLELMTQLQNSPWGAGLLEKSRERNKSQNNNRPQGNSRPEQDDDTPEAKVKKAAAKKAASKKPPKKVAVAIGEKKPKSHPGKSKK